MQLSVVLDVFKGTVCVILSAIQLAMTARAILSWFPIEPNKFTTFLNVITEPVVYPIRKLFEKMNWFQNIPLDMSFMTAFIIISILLLLLA
ncbi:MAG: YggT family protein [Clostridia bacterium]|nr:YggT family protein [Clostridia bacterium]